MSKEDIAVRLRSARLAAHKTQKEAADALGMTYQAISSYERGITNVESGVLIRLCQFYGVSVPDILGEPTSPDKSIVLSNDETQLVLDYRKLSPVGAEYIRQTMAMAVHSYAGEDSAVPQMEAAE